MLTTATFSLLFLQEVVQAGYSWERSIQMGLKHNAEIRQAQQSIREFTGRKMEAQSVFYPNGSLQALIFPPSFVNINVQQNVFAAGAAPRVEQAEAAIQAAEANVQLEILEFVIRSRVAFLEILLREKQIDLQREFANKIKIQLKMLPSLFEGGIVQKSDIQTMEVRHALALTSVNEATWAWKESIVEYADLLGSPEAVELLEKGVAGVLEPRIMNQPNLDMLVKTAYQNRHDLKLLEKLLQTDTKGVLVASAGYYPSWIVFGNLDLGWELPAGLEDINNLQNEDDDDDEQSAFRAGSRFSWRLFDGFRTSGRKQAAKANTMATNELYKQVKRNIPGEVAGALRQYQDARKIYELLQTGLIEENSEQVKRSFLRNQITQVEVFKSEEESFEAKRNELLALYNMELARVNLYAATGQLVKIIEDKD